MKRARGWAALLVVGTAVAIPAAGAAQGSVAELLSDEGREDLQQSLDKSRAASRARPRAALSSRRLTGLTDAQAVRSATEAYPGLFAAHPTRLLALRPEEHVERYLGDYAARLDVSGQADAIVSSDLPLRVGPDGEKKAVDLVLVDGANSLAPAAPLVPTTYPKRLADGLTVDSQIRMRLVGAARGTVAEQTGQQVVYANALPDADLLATPMPLGLETFVQLRSPDSPTELSFEFELPGDARLEPEIVTGKATGRVSIVLDNREIGRVRPPVANDVNGAPVDVTTKVLGQTLTLSVDVDEASAFPVLVDPIVEGQWDNPNDPNGGFVYTNGWRRDSSVGLAAFSFNPDADTPAHGGQCVRPDTHTGVIEPIQNAICVTTRNTLNYPLTADLQSIGAWTWRPPAGVRAGADDFPIPNTDAFLYRADVRNGYVDFQGAGGNTAMIAGLISGKTHDWVGAYHVIYANDPPQTPASTKDGTSPFIQETSNSSFFGTYCAHPSCTADLNDPVYNGTYMLFGVFAAGTGQTASALAQGAQLYQSDPSPPVVAHIPVSDSSAWYRAGSFTSRVTASDFGMGMDRMGVTFARPSPQPAYFDGVDLPCQAITTNTCPTTIPATSFSYDTNQMPEGRNTVSGVGIDILGRRTEEPMKASIDPGAPAVSVKVDRSKPTLIEIGGTLSARNGRALVDATYTATAKVHDGLSGVQVLGYAIDAGAPVTQPPLSCPGNDCPQDPNQLTFSVNTAALTAGQHTVSVYAKDSAGNELRQIAWIFVVDHAAPTITALTHTPPLTGWFGSRTLTAEGTATDDASGIKRFTLTTPTSGGSQTSTDTVLSG